MKDYIIWCAEKLQRLNPALSWDYVMDLVTGEVPSFDISKIPGYSVEIYLKEEMR